MPLFPAAKYPAVPLGTRSGGRVARGYLTCVVPGPGPASPLRAPLHRLPPSPPPSLVPAPPPPAGATPARAAIDADYCKSTDRRDDEWSGWRPRTTAGAVGQGRTAGMVHGTEAGKQPAQLPPADRRPHAAPLPGETVAPTAISSRTRRRRTTPTDGTEVPIKVPERVVVPRPACRRAARADEHGGRRFAGMAGPKSEPWRCCCCSSSPAPRVDGRRASTTR